MLSTSMLTIRFMEWEVVLHNRSDCFFRDDTTLKLMLAMINCISAQDLLL